MDRRDITTRFWDKVSKSGEDDCWVFTGCKSIGGYGFFTINGNNVLAHRMAYKLTFGEIPYGKLVCHTCDNRICVNPKHLFVGDYSMNNQDCWNKGRHPPTSGKFHGRAKLTENKAVEIVSLYKNGNVTQRVLGKMFGVGATTVCDIVNGRRWNEKSFVD
jgi:hypothetical protein